MVQLVTLSHPQSKVLKPIEVVQSSPEKPRVAQSRSEWPKVAQFGVAQYLIYERPCITVGVNESHTM